MKVFLKNKRISNNHGEFIPIYCYKVTFICGNFKIRASLCIMGIFISSRKRLVKHTDEELVTLFTKEKDKKIIDELFYRYSHLVLGTCMKYLKNKMDSEDLTLTIFSKLGEKLLKHEVKQFKNWFHTLTKNECYMLLRKKKPAMDISIDSLTLSDEDELTEEKIVMERNLLSLENALQQIKAPQRKCIELFYLHRKSYDEIVKISGFTLLQVKSNIQNGKRNLRILIDKEKINEF